MNKIGNIFGGFLRSGCVVLVRKKANSAAAKSLDQKYDFEPATGNKFFCLNMFLLHLKILNQPLDPQ
jgi:hypothetical protein